MNTFANLPAGDYSCEVVYQCQNITGGVALVTPDNATYHAILKSQNITTYTTVFTKVDGEGHHQLLLRPLNVGDAITVHSVSIRPVTSAPILTRQDLCFLEVNPNAECTVFKPLGNNQYGADTADGITLKKLTDLGISQSVSAFGVWDKETVGHGELISSLTDAQLKTVLSNPKNNLRFDPIQNKLLQSEYKICVEEGYNDTDTVDERMTKLGYVKDTVDVTRYNHADGRQAIGVCLRQTLNSGAYHPVFNSAGCGIFYKIGNGYKPWYYVGVSDDIHSTKDCCEYYPTPTSKWTPAPSGSITTINSGRPSSFPDQFYDAAYAHQIKDLRLSAHKQDVNKLRVDAMRKAVAGETRGWGKVPTTFTLYVGDTPFRRYHDGFLTAHSPKISGLVSQYFGCQESPTHPFLYLSDGKIENMLINQMYILFTYNDSERIFKIDTYMYDITVFTAIKGDILDLPNSITVDVTNMQIIVSLFDGASYTKQELSSAQRDTLAWTDLVGSPSALAATFKDGVQGMWIPQIPDGTQNFRFDLNTKNSTSTLQYLFTTDNGGIWRTGNGSGGSGDGQYDTVTNTWGGTLPPTAITLIQYPTLSKFTKSANNAKVAGEVGDVIVTTRHEINQGNRLHGSLLVSIGKDTNNALTDVSKTRQTTMLIEHVPHGFTTPANSSTGCKVTTSIIEKDGLLYSQYQAIELVNNGTDWGDTSNAIPVVNGDSTHTDDNGNTVKIVNHHGMMPLGIASHSDSSQSS